MKIFFSGGGTLGSVTPLIALEQMIHEEFESVTSVWITTRTGIENELLEEKGIKPIRLFAGKLPRYFSVRLFFQPFLFFLGFIQSFFILLREKPDFCVTAGGFVSVPLHIAAFLLKVPCWVHQLDLQVGLANKIMGRFAKIITVTFEDTLKKFPNTRVQFLGGLSRDCIKTGNRARAQRIFELPSSKPVLLVLGGGTGSYAINKIILESISDLSEICSVLHITGSGDRIRKIKEKIKQAESRYDYRAVPFLTDRLPDAYAIADVVVSRGGLGTILELASLSKPAVFVGKAGQQEENVSFLVKKEATLFLNEEDGNRTESLLVFLRDLFENPKKAQKLGHNLCVSAPRASKKTVEHILEKLFKGH